MTLLELASRFVGHIQERPGFLDHPFIQWALSLCGYGFDAADEVAWCSAVMNAWAFICGYEMTRSAAARSWLTAGTPTTLEEADGNCVVVLSRGSGPQPGPEVLAAPGHVVVFEALNGDTLRGVGGNQSNGISHADWPVSRVLGVRRLS